MTSPSLAPGKPCPICAKPSVEQYRPFCGRRCADVDLNRWLSGVYAVPVEDSEDEADQVRPAGGGEERS
ncbi:MAG: DNA gyrase inhibitor YacG [Pseudorhodoplanes sp.]|nr:DNA gyrase inhibitor YacG [Pseudorhodoplanes sp.]